MGEGTAGGDLHLDENLEEPEYPGGKSSGSVVLGVHQGNRSKAINVWVGGALLGAFGAATAVRKDVDQVKDLIFHRDQHPSRRPSSIPASRPRNTLRSFWALYLLK